MSRKATVVSFVIGIFLGLYGGYLIGGSERENSTPNQEVIDQQKADHLAWCDSIYHQNVSCPKEGEIDIPQEVIDKQEAEFLAWCDSIYHRNVSCPKHGEIDIPQEVIDQEKAEFLKYCDIIDYQNVACPKEGEIDIP